MTIADPPGRGRGNHRKGRSKGEHNRHRQKPWRQDPEVLERILMVSDPSLSEQPIPVILKVVNARLEQLQREPVSERTIRNDLQRAYELYQERIIPGAAARMKQLQQLWAKNWRALASTPEGPQQAPLIATGIRLVISMAELEGSWGKAADLTVQVEQHNYGPAPYERVQAGEISPEAYRGWLEVVAAQQDHQPLLGPAQGQEEGADKDAPQAGDWTPPPEPPRGVRTPRSEPPPAGMPRPARGSVPEPRIVDWAPDEDEE